MPSWKRDIYMCARGHTSVGPQTCQNSRTLLFLLLRKKNWQTIHERQVFSQEHTCFKHIPVNVRLIELFVSLEKTKHNHNCLAVQGFCCTMDAPLPKKKKTKKKPNCAEALVVAFEAHRPGIAGQVCVFGQFVHPGGTYIWSEKKTVVNSLVLVCFLMDQPKQ